MSPFTSAFHQSFSTQKPEKELPNAVRCSQTWCKRRKKKSGPRCNKNDKKWSFSFCLTLHPMPNFCQVYSINFTLSMESLKKPTFAERNQLWNPYLLPVLGRGGCVLESHLPHQAVLGEECTSSFQITHRRARISLLQRPLFKRVFGCILNVLFRQPGFWFGTLNVVEHGRPQERGVRGRVCPCGCAGAHLEDGLQLWTT